MKFICEKEKLPILMHTGDNRYDYSNPNRLLPILQIYTSLTVVGESSVWGSSSSEERPNTRKNLSVVTYSMGLPGTSSLPQGSMSFLSHIEDTA